MEDYMHRMLLEQTTKERQKKRELQQKLWERNPITNKKVIAEKYNNDKGWR